MNSECGLTEEQEKIVALLVSYVNKQSMQKLVKKVLVNHLDYITKLKKLEFVIHTLEGTSARILTASNQKKQ